MTPADVGTPTGSPQADSKPSLLRSRFGFALRVALVRVRFYLVLIAIFLVLAAWNQLGRLRDRVMMQWGALAAFAPGTGWIRRCQSCSSM